MKHHDNIRVQQYSCKHVPHALAVSAFISFCSPFCLFLPSSFDFLSHCFPSVPTCFSEEFSTEESIWSHCHFDLRMDGWIDGWMEGGMKGLRLHVSSITPQRWQGTSVLHAATGGRKRDAWWRPKYTSLLPVLTHGHCTCKNFLKHTQVCRWHEPSRGSSNLKADIVHMFFFPLQHYQENQ